MKPVIATTDFSPASLNAVNYAADLALATNSKLALVHIFQLPVIYGEVPVAVDSINQQIANVEAKMKSLKKQLAVRTNWKINIDTVVKTNGVVVAEIETYCKSIMPSFVVMGSQGSSAIERLLFGSNTITAMRKLSWPLIIVPREAIFKKLNKIGLACDLKNVAETIPVEDVSMLVRQFNAKLHVIHINTENKTKYSPDLIDECSQAQEMLQELHPSYYFLINSNIDEGLRVFAEKENLDLLIVIPKNHGPIGKPFHMSQAKQLILHTHIPVLSVHE